MKQQRQQQVCQSPAGVGTLTLRPVLYRVMVVVVGCLVSSSPEFLAPLFYSECVSCPLLAFFFLGNKKEQSFPATLVQFHFPPLSISIELCLWDRCPLLLHLFLIQTGSKDNNSEKKVLKIMSVAVILPPLSFAFKFFFKVDLKMLSAIWTSNLLETSSGVVPFVPVLDSREGRKKRCFPRF